MEIVCYSGGHSSALTAIETARRFGKDRVILLNHDIIPVSEGADIKRFKRQVADYLEISITYCNMDGWDAKDQFDVVVEAGAFKVGTGTALCTNRMKTQPFEDWLKTNADPTQDVIYYGFDLKESDRIQRRSSHLALLGYKTDFPLALWKDRTIWRTAFNGSWVNAPAAQQTRFLRRFRTSNNSFSGSRDAKFWELSL